MVTNINCYDDVIDSRDVIARIEELEDTEDADEKEELTILETLATEASNYSSDWKYGEQLIRYSYFREYAEELADDLGLIDSNATWPMDCIDWDRAARELEQDYAEVMFGDVAYLIRST